MIQNGGSVKAADTRIRGELERVAAATTPPARLQAVAGTGLDTDLEQLAREALARAQSATRAKKARPVMSSTSKLPTRSFVFLWTDLHDWWLRYDHSEISAELTDEQWHQFEVTLAGTIAFFEQMRTLRESSGAAQLTATISSIR